MNISIMDTIIVFSYMIGCVILGFIKFDQIKNIRDYTLGSRPFTTTVLIATTFATAISAHKTIGSVGKSYSMGLVFILSMFLIPIARVIIVNSFLSLFFIFEFFF